ncbi:DUF2808 domain-containing protein [Neosynechococcus sphagnicola]|nr:DUF2808 domain-containing protein [Neosynechococcus sphagnicola]
MGNAIHFGALVMLSSVVGITGQVEAIQLGDGSRAFVNPPRLLGAVTTSSDVYAWNSTYYFTLQIPEDAGEPLQKVVIVQQEGLDLDLDYNLKQFVAFEGASYRKRGAPIAIGNVGFDRKNQTVTVSFDPPVVPGTTVTVGLRPYANPDTSGVYLFGVTAFPPGERTRSQFLGFGRLTFYRGRD